MPRTVWLAGLVLTAVVATGCTVVEDGYVGVAKSFGSISDEPVGQGVVIQVPVVRTVEVWNIKLQELKETASVPSSEGLIVGLDASLLFRVLDEAGPPDPQDDRHGTTWRSSSVPYFRNAPAGRREWATR